MKQSSPAKKGPLARWLARKAPALRAMLRGASYISLMPRPSHRRTAAGVEQYIKGANKHWWVVAEMLGRSYEAAKAKELEAAEIGRED